MTNLCLGIMLGLARASDGAEVFPGQPHLLGFHIWYVLNVPEADIM